MIILGLFNHANNRKLKLFRMLMIIVVNLLFVKKKRRIVEEKLIDEPRPASELWSVV